MMRTATLRRWYLIHRWTSLVCTLFLLMDCLTGLPLVFEDELGDLLAPHVHPAQTTSGASTASLDRMVVQAREIYPALHPYAIGFDDDEPRVFVNMTATENPKSISEFHQVIFDRHSGVKLEEPKSGSSVMNAVLELHRSLFLGLPGELIMAIVALCFVASLVSGTMLYAPFMRRLRFGTYRINGPFQLRWFDLHNVVGIVTLMWMLVVGTTGLMNTLATPLFRLWRMQTMPKLLKPYHGKTKPAHVIPVDEAVRTAEERLSSMEVASVLFPNGAVGSPLHYVVWMKGETPITARLMTPALIDVETGSMTAARPLPWYLRALEVSRPLHFGDYGGTPLKILWGGFDLAATLVLVSGVYLWLKKQNPFRAELIEDANAPTVQEAGA